MKKILKKITMALATFSLVFAVAAPGAAVAQTTNDVREGVDITGDAGQGPDVQQAVRAAINVLSVVVGVIAVIMIIIGGLKYITSNGDSNQISSAKNTIIYALIGLVVVVIAQAVVRFVLQAVEQQT